MPYSILAPQPVIAAVECCAIEAPVIAPDGHGSRRRRLWELGKHVLCPVLGACVPISDLRRLVNKRLGGRAMVSDYELHCGVIAECQRRTPISKALQTELDRRYAPELRRAAGVKSSAALLQWWSDTSADADAALAGLFWATLTHARCTADVQEQVVAQVHMLQHQVGTAQRANHAELRALRQANAARRTELTTLQVRMQQRLTEHAQQTLHLRTELDKARTDVVGLTTRLATIETRDSSRSAQTLEKTNLALKRQDAWQRTRIDHLERTLAQAQAQLEAARSHHRQAHAKPSEQQFPCDRTAACAPTDRSALLDQSVLCVGGRPASVPLYRHIVEGTGGRFLHHDGGDEQKVSRLDASLAAADLVICQTGCISHDAYWRVKDHCKRTGKPCVFVENPGSASLKRALYELCPSALA